VSSGVRKGYPLEYHQGQHIHGSRRFKNKLKTGNALIKEIDYKTRGHSSINNNKIKDITIAM
jgi:hypothetical protein